MRSILLLIISAFIGPFLIINLSYAQEDNKVIIKANRIFGSQKKNIVNAVGNVEISKSSQTVITNKIEYDKNTGWIKSNSNIELIDPNLGNLFAKQADFKDDFSEGKFKEPLIIFKDDELFLNRFDKKSLSPLNVLQRC